MAKASQKKRIDEVDIAAAVLPLERGVMIDVGAHRGSASIRFASRGWVVHAFEPDPLNQGELERRSARFPNYVVRPDAVGKAPDKRMLYRSDVSSGISTLTPFHPSHRPASVVRVVTLDDYIGEAGIEYVDFLKTDAEGHDLFALEGFPWGKFTPSVVICEFEDRKTRPLGYSWTDECELLLDCGYELFVSEWFPIVEYGREHAWRSIRRYPTELLDPRAWGNVVAVRPEMGARVAGAVSVVART